jgi:hypothetical protein
VTGVYSGQQSQTCRNAGRYCRDEAGSDLKLRSPAGLFAIGVVVTITLAVVVVIALLDWRKTLDRGEAGQNSAS